MEDEATRNLREYIKIKSVHPDPDYEGCVTFLKKIASQMGLPVKVFGTKEKPVVVITWEGKEKNLPTIILNSHMDVVPVFEENWTHKPFEAFKDVDGKIYGRGTQDMKSVGMQHLEAVRRLKNKNFKPKRTVHLLFVPDEETGSAEGMAKFVMTKEFKSLNGGFALDESCPSSMDFYIVFYTERLQSSFKIECKGKTGHGSLLHESTAGEKLGIIIDEVYNYRSEQVKKHSERAALANESNPCLDMLALAEVTTINLTELKGGVQNNVVPPEIIAYFDCRLSIKEDQNKFKNWLQSICQKAGEGVSFKFKTDEPRIPPTDFEKNPFCLAMFEALKKKNWNYKPIGCYGCTDSRFLRRVGIPSIGLTPIKNCDFRCHGHDEYVTESEYLNGIDVFVEVITAITQV